MGQSCSIRSLKSSESSANSNDSSASAANQESKKKGKSAASANPGKSKSKMAPVIVSPSGKHTATLIFLHGLGDTGHGWASSLAEVRQSHVKIVCPTANTIPVTLNSGMYT